jgi:hypothetical protein
MRRLMRPTLAAISLAGALAVAVATPASAAGNKQVIPLTCNGTTYQATIAGNGDWAPARDNNSTLVFHPTAFGEFTGTFTPADGSPPTTQTDPPFARKTQPRNGRETINCTFRIHFADSTGVFDGSGSVVGYTTGTPKH